ncbi:unnamed protein product [Chironomus riparius]|uniref:Uncharacterized protein n=1 Tax=Chironomus riparius TaxID=315576 RepID=A0A9N9RWY9_9DIPT|nr:unnamed protein product [Chironomus riparius]
MRIGLMGEKNLQFSFAAQKLLHLEMITIMIVENHQKSQNSSSNDIHRQCLKNYKKAKQEQEQGKATRKLLKKKIKENLPTIAECMMNAWLNE